MGLDVGKARKWGDKTWGLTSRLDRRSDWILCSVALRAAAMAGASASLERMVIFISAVDAAFLNVRKFTSTLSTDTLFTSAMDGTTVSTRMSSISKRLVPVA